MVRPKKEPHFYQICKSLNYAVVFLDNGETFNVNLEDLDWVLQHRWFIAKGINHRIQGLRTTIYLENSLKKGKNFLLHRLIFEKMGLYIEGIFLDHKDRDVFNNTRDNLRIVTKSQNSMNTQKRLTNSTGYKGVSFDKRCKKYVSQINVDGKHIFLGYYLDVKQAAFKYDEAAEEYFGEFACLNFPKV